MAMALALAGREDEALRVHNGVVAAAEATKNPHALSQALLAEGLIHRYTDPIVALSALRRSLQIAQASGNRFNESHIAVTLAQLEMRHGEVHLALHHLGLAIRNYQDSGNIATSRSPLAILAALLDEIGMYEGASTISDFASNPLSRMAFSEIVDTAAHLRDVLGDEAYDALARKGASMTNAAMAGYALEQIDLARAAIGKDASS
jgi:ketosteroid isomerase-like protein